MDGYADYNYIQMRNFMYFKELHDLSSFFKKSKDFRMTVLSPSNRVFRSLCETQVGSGLRL